MAIDILACISGAETALNLLEKASKSNFISSLKYKFKKIDYYFDKTIKEITLDINGNAIITYCTDVCVINPNKPIEIKRSINIDDADINTKFTDLEDMRKCDIHNAPNQLGFWYKSTEDVVQGIEERDWDIEQPTGYMNNHRILQWVFKLDPNKLSANRMYRIVYVVSIPGMYPITNGHIDVNKLPNSSIKSSISQMHISYMVNKIIYKLNLDVGINLKSTPSCEKIIHKHNNNDIKTPIKALLDTDLRYNKYAFVTERPEFGSTIRIKWDVNE